MIARAKGRLDARQRLGRVPFEAQHDDRCRVRRPRQPEAIRPLGAHTVDRDHLLRALELRLRLETFDQRKVLALGRMEMQFRRRHRGGQGIQDRRRIGRPRQDLEQSRTRVQAIVEAGPAIVEEQVPAHLAGERRAACP